MEHEGVTPAQGCPHYITKQREVTWKIQHGNKPTRCAGCNVEGFIPTQRLRATKRTSYEAERPGIQVDRHLA